MDSYKDLRAMVNKHMQKKKRSYRTYGKSNKELNALIEKKFQKFIKKNRNMEKEIQHFQEIQIPDNESKKSISSAAENIESGEISSSSSEWKIGSDKLFVTCLNDNAKNKIAKPITNYLDLLIKTSLNHMSIRSQLVSQPKNKLISNSEQLFYAAKLSPITFDVILLPNPRRKNPKNSQINPGTSDEKNKS